MKHNYVTVQSLVANRDTWASGALVCHAMNPNYVPRLDPISRALKTSGLVALHLLNDEHALSNGNVR